MLKKITGLLAGLLMTAGVLVAVSAAPAQAAPWSTPWKCVNSGGNGYAFTTCNSIEWTRQADGDGVRLEGMRIWTSNGCGELEDSGGKYNPVIGVLHTNTGHADYYYDFGAEGCTFYKDLSNAIGDTGWADVVWQMTARVNWASDRWLTFEWHINSAGDWTLIEASSQNT